MMNEEESWWSGRWEIWQLRSWTLAQAASATSWHSFLVTVSYLTLATCWYTSLDTGLGA